uniref:Uncharacterized protein n=1 Tax=Cebus imitator TaxID=2715852 RepID=A0A2K5QA86_CEBIM
MSLCSSPTLPTSLERGHHKTVSVSHCLEARPAKAWAHSHTGSPRRKMKPWERDMVGGLAQASEVSAQLEKSPEAFSLEGTLPSLSLLLGLRLQLRMGRCAQGRTHQSTREGGCLGASPGPPSVPSAHQRDLEFGE